jgi:hypothetical protein
MAFHATSIPMTAGLFFLGALYWIFGWIAFWQTEKPKEEYIDG